MTHRIPAKNRLSLQAKFARLAEKSKPSKRAQTRKIFHELFHEIEQCLANGKTLTEARELFNEIAKTCVCARTFTNLLNAERRHRQEDHGRSHAAVESLTLTTHGRE
ncbi:hypothetical protein [Dyella agri]|uniref:Uncharacterized protein n=1 Tax=Dyella agri TaxID=1926869 RepID=A0ABW8KEZ5_9GAMM